MPLTRRRRRWIALFALLGLLFQQFAMATYLCPQVAAALASADAPPPCHAQDRAAHDASDPGRCREHCSPTSGKVDQAPALTVPPALVPATAWEIAPPRIVPSADRDHAQRLGNAHPPPLNVRFCSYQI